MFLMRNSILQLGSWAGWKSGKYNYLWWV